jgi:hypothetical protein
VSGTLLFASGRAAPGVCVQMPGSTTCQAVSNADGLWQVLVTVSAWPNGATFIYLYDGVEKGRQTQPPNQLVGGDLVFLGRYVLAP